MRKSLITNNLAAVVGVFLGFSSLGHAQLSTATSVPMGFYTLDLEVGFQTVGVSVVNPAIFGSWVASSGASTITAQDATVDVGGLLDADKSYYVEIVEGPTGTGDALVGQRFEVAVATTINAATANGVVALEMDNERTTWVNSPVTNPTTAPALAGYRFELRPHVTLAQIFDPFSLHGALDFADADQVQVFNGSGFSIYYILGNGDDFAQWTQQAGGFDSQNNLPITPGQGLIFKRSTLSPGATSLRVQGMARVSPFVQPMKAGFNFVSEGFPVSNSFDGKDAYPADFSNGDRVQIFNGTGFTTYELLIGGGVNLWVEFGDGTFASQNASELFDYRGAVFVDIDSATDGYRIDPPYAP